nr:reverse transcriptase domain-containing protein [Tanacetum cinerariifolium]
MDPGLSKQILDIKYAASGTLQRGSSNSNEDLIKKISHSIYVTNFPDSVTSRDLRRECSNYGTVVDVFIPLKKSKAGRRLCKLKRGGLKDTYPDEILAPVLKVKTMAQAQDCLLQMGVTSENISQRLSVTRKEQDQAGCSENFVGEKIAYAISQGLKVVSCVGVTLAQREAGTTMEVVIAQTQAIVNTSAPGADIAKITRKEPKTGQKRTRERKERVPNVVEPEIRTIVEVAPMADNRTMEELLQAFTEGYGEAIIIPEINAGHFEIKTNLLQLVQVNPYHGFERKNHHTHINNFKRITSTLRFKDVPNDVIRLMMLPYSLEGAARTTHLKNEISRFTQRFEETFEEAWERFKKMLRACPHHGFTELTQIDTFYNGLNDNDQDSLNAAEGGNLLSKTTREALSIIENKSKVRYLRNKPNVYRMNTTSRENTSKTDDMIDKLADQISTLVDIFAKKVVTPATAKAVEESCVTCGGAHAYYNCPNTDSNQSSVCATTGSFFQNQASTSGTLLSNTIPNPKGEMKAIITRSSVAYEGPSIPTNHSLKKVVEQETEETTNKEQTNFQGSTVHIQPSVAPIPEPDVPKNSPKTNIPYPSRLNDQKLRKKAKNQMDKFFQIFQDLHFDITFADALLLMLKFAFTIKSLLANKDKLFELAKIPLNENCSAMLLKKLPKKFRDLGKYLIPCDFPGMDDLKLGEVAKAKSLIKEPPKLELKDLPSHLEYAYLEGVDKLLVIIAKDFKDNEKEALLKVLKSHKRAIAWKITDIKGSDPRFCILKILMEENYKPAFVGNEFYSFLDGFSGYFQIPINPPDQEKTTFTCPYGTFAYRRMPFGLCNAHGTFQRYYATMVRRHQLSSKLGEMPLYGQRGNFPWP